MHPPIPPEPGVRLLVLLGDMTSTRRQKWPLKPTQYDTIPGGEGLGLGPALGDGDGLGLGDGDGLELEEGDGDGLVLGDDNGLGEAEMTADEIKG